MTGRAILGAVLATLVLATGMTLIAGATPAPPGHHHGAAAQACTGAATLDLACRTGEYTVLAQAAGVGVALARLDEDRRSDGFLRSACHEIVHHLGYLTGGSGEPVAAAYAEGTAMCSGGYFHGVTEAAMVLAGPPAADTVCADVAAARPRSLQHLWCAHGMGHGYTALHGGDVFAALAACDRLPAWDADQCYGGVIMENVTSLADPSGPSRFLRADDPLYPCPAVADRQKARCYEKQTAWALFRHGGEMAPVFALCAAAPDVAFRPACYRGLGDRAVVRSEKLLVTEQDKADAVAGMCEFGPDASARSECVAGAVRTIVRHGVGDGIADRLCSGIADPAVRELCWRTRVAAVDEYRGTG